MHGRCKLTPEQAIEVHLLARSKRHFQWQIGEAFGITQSQVSLIQHRRRWCSLFNNNEGHEMTEDELKAELDALKTRQAELEAKLDENKPSAPFKAEPYQPRDWTAGATMDRETKRELAKAIPDDLARDLRADLARGNPITQSVAQLTPDRGRGGVQVQRGSGWAEPNPLTPPPGVELCDRIMDMADRQDRADLERRLARSVKTK
jgi:hypothetical protein